MGCGRSDLVTLQNADGSITVVIRPGAIVYVELYDPLGTLNGLPTVRVLTNSPDDLSEGRRKYIYVFGTVENVEAQLRQ